MKKNIINNVNIKRKALGNIVFKVIVGISVLAVIATFLLKQFNVVNEEELVDFAIISNLISIGIFAILLPFGSIFWETMGGIYDKNKIILKIIVCFVIAIGTILVSIITWSPTVIQIAMYLSLLSLVFSLIPTIKPEEIKEMKDNA